MLAVYKKELKSYFTSMMGYVFIAFFLVIIGIYFMAYNLAGQYANFEYVLSSAYFAFIILVPIITMRLMAEEKKQKTDQLLFTSPLPVRKIILGKYLAVLTVFLVAMGIVSIYPLIIMQYGSVPLKIAYGAIFGFFLLGAAYIALGLFISSTTESQIVAAVVSFIIILLTVFMSDLVGMLPTDIRSSWIIFSAILIILCWVTYLMMHNATLSLIFAVLGEIALTVIYTMKPSLFSGLVVKVFNWFSVTERFSNFSNGILDFSSVIYYISIVFLFVFLTVQAIKKSRWS